MSNINNMKEILSLFLLEKANELKGNGFSAKVTKDFPKELLKTLGKEGFTAKGSVGIGQWSEIPWICIYNEKITRSSQQGFYIAILFKADMSGFYLTLNQGWTYFQKKYGTTIGKQKIVNVSEKVRNLLTIQDFSPEKIDLSSKRNLALGYTLGTIVSKYYSADNLPIESVFVNDLNKMLEVYDQVAKLIGSNRSFQKFISELLSTEDGLYNESENLEIFYQDKIEENNSSINIKEPTSNYPTLRGEPLKSKNGEISWPRDAKMAANSIRDANFSCEIDSKHFSFISEKTKKMYVEAHHIIPMKAQKNFTYSLDKIANIKSLCPNCHRMIHHGKKSERNKLVVKLFEDNRINLKLLNIDIDIEELLKYY